MGSTAPPNRAIVAHNPIDGKPNWKMETVGLPPVGNNELVVRMVATGVCSTDMWTASSITSPTDFPRVVGHEGAGYVAEVGPGVTNAKVGDSVLLSFDHCSACNMCSSYRPAYCKEWRQRNMVGTSGCFFAEDKTPYRGKYFGQSSFASMTVVAERSIVNVTGLVASEDELRLLAPLGCGFQTGSGAVTNIARAGPSDTVVIFGLGGVGFAAIMAAKNQGCAKIIGVDIVESKMAIAKRHGTTHCFNSSSTNILEAIKDVTGGTGASIAIDTTGNMSIIQTAIDCTSTGGQAILIGVPKPGDALNLIVIPFILSGKQIKGCVEGDVVPSKYLPKLIQWIRDGKYPIEQIIKYYPVDDFQQAIYDMKSGLTIKPVLLW